MEALGNYRVLALALLVALFGALPLGWWQGVERRSFDLRLRALAALELGHRTPSGKVVVVGLREELQTREKPLLFWYPEFGRFVREMARSGAAVVGIDLVPNQSLAAKLGGADEGLVGKKLSAAQSAALEEVGRRADLALVDALRESRATPVVQGVEDRLLPFYYAAMAEWGTVVPGLLRLDSDPDFTVRRFRPSALGELDPFASALFARCSSRTPPGELLLNYLLAPRIPVLSLHDVLSGKVPAGYFTGKAVILCYLGRTEDRHGTPLGLLPGGLVHAVALETMLTGTAFAPAPVALRLLAVALLTLLSFLAATRFRPVAAGAVALLLALGYVAADTLLLAAGHLLPLFPGVVIPLLSLTVYYPCRYLTEERHRQRIYKAFSYYIEPRLLDVIIAKDPSALLKGERREICIFFLDVRNFTRLSTTRSAEDIVGFLNLFFGRVTEVIQRHDGFVDKFIGDGLMAFFMAGENPPLNAVQAAREVLGIVEGVNESGEVRTFLGEWEVGVGIGLNHGSVILGNVGSERKMDFTVIGDPVNVASRIEGLTKTAGRPILISSSVYEAVREHVPCACVGSYEVKGVAEPLTLYTVKEEIGEEGR